MDFVTSRFIEINLMKKNPNEKKKLRYLLFIQKFERDFHSVWKLKDLFFITLSIRLKIAAFIKMTVIKKYFLFAHELKLNHIYLPYGDLFIHISYLFIYTLGISLVLNFPRRSCATHFQDQIFHMLAMIIMLPLPSILKVREGVLGKDQV